MIINLNILLNCLLHNFICYLCLFKIGSKIDLTTVHIQGTLIEFDCTQVLISNINFSLLWKMYVTTTDYNIHQTLYLELGVCD